MTPEAAALLHRVWPRMARRLRGLLPDLLSFGAAMAWAAIAALLVSLAGCGGAGGGVGTEGTGSYASGPISGFGSIVVNDVHYDLPASTSIEDDDGQPIDSAALQLGTVVQLRAGAVAVDADGLSRATALEVRTVRALVGTVSAVDAANARLTVLGQAVAVSANTVFGDGWSGGVASVPIGQSVVVYGDYDNAAAAIQATRIAPATAIGAALLRAPVGSIDAANRTFTIGGQTYNYAAVPDPSILGVGTVVKLTLAAMPDSGGRWVVRDAEPPPDAGPTARAAVDLRGTVSSLQAATLFKIDNRTIDASRARIEGSLRVGADVRVIGMLQDGVVIASQVESIASGGRQNFELLGPIAAINHAARRFVVRGTTVEWVDAATVFENGNSGDLRVGRLVRVDGRLAADRQSVTATRVRFGA